MKTEKIISILLPVLLCKNIYTSSLESLMNPGIFVFAIVGILAMFFILFFGIPRIEPDRAKCGVMIQAIFRSNFNVPAKLGVPYSKEN